MWSNTLIERIIYECSAYTLTRNHFGELAYKQPDLTATLQKLVVDPLAELTAWLQDESRSGGFARSYADPQRAIYVERVLRKIAELQAGINHA